MEFWWFMLICDVLIPVVMIIVGRMMYKWYVGLQNNSVNEKHGYMEICPRLLRKTLVEDRMDNDYTICFDTYPLIS